MGDRLGDQSVFITGGASGIGAACAERFGAEGAAVVVADLASSAAAAAGLVERIRQSGGTAHSLVCDVTSRESVDSAVHSAVSLVGPLHCAIASAGVATHPSHGFTTDLVEIAPEHWDHVLDVNLTGTLHTAQTCAKHMRSNETPGSIVTLSSFAAKRPTRGVYSVSKAAVWMLTRALAEELGPYGIRVNSIAPGVIDTPMLDDASADSDADAWKRAQAGRTSLGRIGTPADVAAVAMFLASSDSAYITGSILHPDGGLASTFAGG